jgi:hypothetical protein
MEKGDLYSFDGEYLGNFRSDWNRFVNDYFLPSDEVWVSDRLLISILVTLYLFVLLFGSGL